MGFQAAFGVHMRQPENEFTRFCKVKTKAATKLKRVSAKPNWHLKHFQAAYSHNP
ncbi:hypothetical protein GCWU000324_00556 [Kingella oralis ATCC 51147]|uniref:Uncharacterized protein n=1 Tax=Kingella oralis ATCC 51147 TaxID=629741 RepID=C4GI65_9NEIS|nr:hypothetical protein GCWU000324_00556 [Kingella oralis ATCC 51147]